MFEQTAYSFLLQESASRKQCEESSHEETCFARGQELKGKEYISATPSASSFEEVFGWMLEMQVHS